MSEERDPAECSKGLTPRWDRAYIPTSRYYESFREYDRKFLMTMTSGVHESFAKGKGLGLPSTVTMTLTSLIARAYETYRDETAIIAEGGSRTTYGELGAAARRLAGGLASIGIQQGDRVLVALANCSEYLLIDHALLSGGFVRVPLSYRLHDSEILGVAADSGTKLIFTESARVEALRAEIERRGMTTQVAVVDGDHASADHTLSALAEHEELPTASVTPEDLVWLPYTSGTTGEPKGVMVLHRGLMATIRNLMVELPCIDSSDVVLHIGPLSHLSGYLAMVYFTRGAAHITHAEFDAAATLRTIQEHRVTVMPSVPTIITMLLSEAETGAYDLSSLHTVLYGGSAIAPDRLARAVRSFGNVFIQGYGLTEVPFPLTSMSKESHRFDPEGPVPERLASAGRVTPFIDLMLADDEGNEVRPGEIGEIWARGDQIMAGYWNRPEATADVVKRQGWVATGDVGRLVDGYLHIVDRKKDMIVSGGFNVFPSEVENVISAVPGVREVAVVGTPDARWGEAVTAVVSLESGATVTAEDVVAACKASIAGYKKPQTVVFVDELPRTSSGKVLRREIRGQFWQGKDRHVGG
jgi:acyl-CoA synthetase (AMP-forming)/AMP-acid ligase II